MSTPTRPTMIKVRDVAETMDVTIRELTGLAKRKLCPPVEWYDRQAFWNRRRLMRWYRALGYVTPAEALKHTLTEAQKSEAPQTAPTVQGANTENSQTDATALPDGNATEGKS